MEDFTTNMETRGSGELGGGDAVVGKAQVEAAADTVDGLEKPVSMMTKKANIKKLRARLKDR